MTSTDDLMEVMLESWDRANAIMLGLLRVLPLSGLEVAVGDTSTVAQHLGHLHYVRLIEVAENAPEVAVPVPASEWATESDPARIAAWFTTSGAVVRAAVRTRLLAGRAMDHHYDHPLLMIQHLLWHDAYHHGQIKLALRAAGLPLADSLAGPVSWDLWMDKHAARP